MTYLIIYLKIAREREVRMFGLKKLFKKQCHLKGINKPEKDKEIKTKDDLYLNKTERSPKLIISLTSFPERMHDIHYCIYSLFNQTLKADRIILWLARDQFLNKEADIPETVLEFQKYGLEIKWCENLYSYKKLIPALKEFPDDIIITADDDIYYEPDCIEKLYNSSMETPATIVCHRCHLLKTDKTGEILPYKKWKKKISGETVGYKNFFTGAGTVLYPPHCLYKDITDKDLFTKLAPKADDIWFWAMAVLNNTKIKVVKDNISELTYVNPERERGLTGELTLFASNKKGGNDIQLEKILQHYPQIKEIIK